MPSAKGRRPKIERSFGPLLPIQVSLPCRSMIAYFAHATSFCGGVWAPVMSRVHGHDTVTWDFLGHGSAPSLQIPVDWRVFGRQVLEETESGGIGVGHSMGAAAMAMAQIADPTRFRALVLVEPIIFPGPHVRVEHFLSAGALKRKRSFDSREAARANFAGRTAFSGWSPAALDGYVRCGLAGAGPVELACDPEVEADIYRASNDHDTWEHVAEIDIPTLVMVGAESTTITVDHARALVSMMPRAGLEVVEGAGHFLAMERPDIVAARAERLADAAQEDAE